MAFVYDKEAYDMSLFEAEDMSAEDIILTTPIPKLTKTGSLSLI